MNVDCLEVVYSLCKEGHDQLRLALLDVEVDMAQGLGGEQDALQVCAAAAR